jgi:predicted AlkP superfamily pyrophosphatase or phosphodiesterase
MQKTVVLNVVGLSYSLIGEHTPFLKQWFARKHQATIDPMLPAVTTSVQSTYVTGKWPSEHGIVGNGWYDRTDAEVKFWKQSNKLVQGEKIWDRARKLDPSFTVSKMFWWYNMYSTADFSATPRPQYPSDGLKLPDCYTHPGDLRDRLQQKLGQFPLFQFWGPATTIKSTRWIADASMLVDQWHNPTLTLIYLPHLDYCIQKYGQDFGKIATDLRDIDDVCRDLIQFYEQQGAEVIVLSEYGITNVSKPIHINRILREAGLIRYREERGLELFDAGASPAFATADHQVAHIYVTIRPGPPVRYTRKSGLFWKKRRASNSSLIKPGKRPTTWTTSAPAILSSCPTLTAGLRITIGSTMPERRILPGSWPSTKSRATIPLSCLWTRPTRLLN